MSHGTITLEEALMSALSFNVRELRKAKGWSQQTLADAVGVNRVTIARVETGQQMPGWTFVCNLADALGVTTDELRTVSKKLQSTA